MRTSLAFGLRRKAAMLRPFALAVSIVAFASTLRAADSPPVVEPALSASLRTLLLQNLPEPLHNSQRGWDNQKDVLIGMKWHKTGLVRFKPEAMKANRNDGHWQRITVHADDSKRTLALAIADVKYPEPGKTTFVAYLGLDTKLVYEQQLWKSGARLYGGETRAKCRLAVKVFCELTSRFERAPGTILPTAVVRVRVTQSELNYADLAVEHTAGLDGNAAKSLGDAVVKFIKAIQPNLEADLLKKADAAVVRAADTKEVRVAFDSLLMGKLR